MLSDIASALLRGWLYTFSSGKYGLITPEGVPTSILICQSWRSIIVNCFAELEYFLGKRRKELAMFKIGVKMFPVCV